jgi:hypothetical protein
MTYLFSQKRLSEYLEEQKIKLQAEVDRCDPDYLLKVSEYDLREYLVSHYSLQSPQLLLDQVYQHEPQDVNIHIKREDDSWIIHGTMGGIPIAASRPEYKQVTGTAIIISIPFVGDAELFGFQPSASSSYVPQGEIVSQEIRLTYELPRPDAEGLTRRYNQDLDGIKKYVSWVARDVTAFNQSLPQIAQQSITRRKQKLLADRNMSAALGIPIKRREDAPRTYTVPSVRRKPLPDRPEVPTEEPFRPEPSLPDAEYEHILSIIQNMVLVMERSPHAFVQMGEEDMRQHFLVQLNGQYEGQVTGETFNFSGKTDILIRVDGKTFLLQNVKSGMAQKRYLKRLIKFSVTSVGEIQRQPSCCLIEIRILVGYWRQFPKLLSSIPASSVKLQSSGRRHFATYFISVMIQTENYI